MLTLLFCSRATLESGYEFRYPTIREACQEFAYLMYMDKDAGVNE